MSAKDGDLLICMMCGEAPNAIAEQDEYGSWWIYCKKCDCWTEHPPAP